MSPFLFHFLFLFSTLSPSTHHLNHSPYVVVLGVAQDAGYPHPACQKECCLPAWKDLSRSRRVSCLAIVDPVSDERWLFDATPDFTEQVEMLSEIHPLTKTPVEKNVPISSTLGITGVFLTHAHIGHYTGLMYLGREGIGAQQVPVYAMPRMREYLAGNGPWSQLVSLGNIELRPLEENATVKLNERLSVTAFRVPHRDEYSETVGFLVKGPNKSFLFIPDIDKWEKWNVRLEEMLAKVDYAFIDGSFYADGEVPGRSMSEIPHPFVSETMQRLQSLPANERAKVYFIHMNHTNPALRHDSKERKAILDRGLHVAEEGQKNNL